MSIVTLACDPLFQYLADRKAKGFAAISARAKARDCAYDIAGHCVRFFDESDVRFWEMEPNGELASTGVCLANPGEEYVVYAPAGGPFIVDLSALRSPKLTARWYDRRTGKFRGSAVIRGGNVRTEFEPPFTGYAVLHLRCER